MRPLSNIGTRESARGFFRKTATGVCAATVPLVLLWTTGCFLKPIRHAPTEYVDDYSIGANFASSGGIGSSKSAPTLNPETPGFLKLNHNIHVIELEIDCDGCHEIEDNGRPMMPDHDTCSVCHDIDLDVIDEECLLCHVLSPENVAAEAYEEIEVIHSPEPGDGVFNHAAYADDYSTCAQCHTQVTQSTLSTDDLRGTHATVFPTARASGIDTGDCAACHADKKRGDPPASHAAPGFMRNHGAMAGAGQDCMTCHTQETCTTCHQNTQPHSHTRPEWTHSHGKVGTIETDKCLVCHTEQSCRTCHQMEQPKDHTNFFRTRTHGKIATWNRERCEVCHKQDYCQACHIGAAPSMTAQNFHFAGAPCLICHSPASTVAPLRRHGPSSEDACLKCHKF